MSNKGKVIIAAAGPGDADLITVKAMRYLGEADVILVDRLVNPLILERYARPGAIRVDVGKQGGHGASRPQQDINHLLVSYALQGKLVVRLKGGDVSVFSNVLDELETLTSFGISYELVPGVTSALGAAAYAGIPLTARGFSQGLRLLTFQDPDTVPKEDWQNWAHTKDTLVFYMSGRIMPVLLERLRAAGIDPETPLAVVSQATTPYQQVHLGTVGTFPSGRDGMQIASPSLLIIGQVVTLHPRFSWFEAAAAEGSVFNALAPIQDQPTT
jgi:uroporphyrin-III C-methyltransferase/precorrin-2 dehydrogenase/sirohydrochlorin ferrochelatase/uroporphyrin-III C-methyltransferase